MSTSGSTAGSLDVLVRRRGWLKRIIIAEGKAEHFFGRNDWGKMRDVAVMAELSDGSRWITEWVLEENAPTLSRRTVAQSLLRKLRGEPFEDGWELIQNAPRSATPEDGR